MAELVGVNAFALRFGLLPSTVSKAIKSGRIPVAGHNDKGHPLLDIGEARAAWVATFRPRRETLRLIEEEAAADGDAANDSLLQSRAKREMYEAELAQLKYERERGKLVDAETAQQVWVRITTATRTRLMSVPSKVKIRMPELTQPQLDILDALIREALEGLADMKLELDEDEGGTG